MVWVTAGLGCDGDTIAMTGATLPSIEDLVGGVLPGVPRVILHNPVLAYEVGDEFLQSMRDAADGKLDPFLLVVEGSILQGAVRQPAGISGDPFTCATATCRVSFNFVTSSSPPGLLCGSATAEFDLKQTGSLLHTFSVPITLTSRGPCP